MVIDIKVEELVKLIPASAFRKVKETNYWYFALNVRVPALGKVRLVISFDNAEWNLCDYEPHGWVESDRNL